MRKKTPQDYANELMQLHRKSAASAQAFLPYDNTLQLPQSKEPDNPQFEDGTGGIQVNVTTLRRLYPVPNALVTVFTGEPNNMTVLDTHYTNQSGQSKIFSLNAPLKAESQQTQNDTAVFSKYNISVKSDGYIEQIALNVPVFSGVVSVQGIDLLPVTAAGGHTSPQIINQDNNYNL